MIIWVVAGLLGMATGLRIGWALVNQQSVVSGAMSIALGNLAIVAALNWPPLSLLIDTALGWPNVAAGLSQAALVMSAAGSYVMITSVASTRGPAVVRRRARIQYGVAASIAAVTVALFFAGGRHPEVPPSQYWASTGHVVQWLIPLLYVLLALTVVAWLGMRLANASRRGRALLFFAGGMALLVVAGAYLLVRTVGGADGVGSALAIVLCAMAIVAAGALMPALQDWIGARGELRLIEPLRAELERRHPDVGIGARPRGPLVFRVAERLSRISDGLFLEAMLAQQSHDVGADPPAGEVPVDIDVADQASTIARWIMAEGGAQESAFPGRSWLRQPPECSDREWILEIARQYRAML